MRLTILRNRLVPGALAVVIAALAAWQLYGRAPGAAQRELAQVAERYVKAIYSRDFAAAYQWLSARDRDVKSAETYVREQGSFSGFSAQLAAKLAAFIDVLPGEPIVNGDHAAMVARVKLPDVEKLRPLVFGWDEMKLNSLSPSEQAALLATVDAHRQQNALPFLEIDEKFDFVREHNRWHVLLNWRNGVEVEVQVKVPPGAPLVVTTPDAPIRFQPGEPFTIALKLKNPTDKELRARVMHNVEPKSLEKYLGVGDCGAFVPFRLAAGKQEENNSTFLVWTNLPAEIRRFTMIYDFEVDRQSP